MTNIPWAHVSSGSIYSGGKILAENGEIRVERDLGDPIVRKYFELHPERFLGFSELDEPNFSFKSGLCTLYAGTKALAEEAIGNAARGYTWRLGLPFNEHDETPNFLSQLRASTRIHYGVNSVSQVDDCVRACLELWERRASFGIYNIANPGAVSTQEVLQMMQRIFRRVQPLGCWSGGEEGERVDAKTPFSHCILDVSKLLSTGIKLRDAREALETALKNWEAAGRDDTKEAKFLTTDYVDGG